MLGILGLNKRNLNYIKKRNPRKNARLAHNKYRTKKFLEERGVPVPETYDMIDNRQKLFDYDFRSLPESFVIKPNHGSKGRGILIIRKATEEDDVTLKKENKQQSITRIIDTVREKRDDVIYQKVRGFGQNFVIKGEIVSDRKLKKILVGIIDGQHTLGGKPDQILIEEILRPGDNFMKFCEFGLADIRVIAFNLVPIAAMLRMPTKQSGGKANLAQGGIGFGIDISTGKIISMIHHGKLYTEQFPEECKQYQNSTISQRDDILLYSSNIQYFANIGFLGIDRVLSEEGPKLLEINARAGLEIQNITQQPLEGIMKKIADLKINTPGKGVEITKTLFSKKKASITALSKTIYLSQQGKLLFTDDNLDQWSEDVIVTVDTNKKQNYMSPTLAKKLKKATTVTLQLPSGIIIKEPSLSKSAKVHGEHISLGRNSLQNYYIKPVHKARAQTDIFAEGVILQDELDQLQIIDQKIHDISRQFSLSKILKPTNYLDEFDIFITKRGKYNPQFTYDFPSNKSMIMRETEVQHIRDEHHDGTLLQSPFAQLFYDKLKELRNKLGLIKAYTIQDVDQIEYYNEKLYGKTQDLLREIAEQKIKEWKNPPITTMGNKINSHQAIIQLKKYLSQKELTGVRVVQDSSLGSRISVSIGTKPKIKFQTRAIFREMEFKALLAHEVDTHLTRFINGQKTGWHILRTGTAGYITTEEGLAIHAADKVYQQYIKDFDSIGKYKNYLLVEYAKTHSFRDTCKFVDTLPYYGGRRRSNATKFQTIVKFKKGIKDTSKPRGSYYKNKVYLDGYFAVEDISKEEYEKNGMKVKSHQKYLDIFN